MPSPKLIQIARPCRLVFSSRAALPRSLISEAAWSGIWLSTSFETPSLVTSTWVPPNSLAVNIYTFRQRVSGQLAAGPLLAASAGPAPALPEV